jgi:hypothetical protein
MINEFKEGSENEFTSLANLTFERISHLEEEMLENHDKHHYQDKCETVTMVMISMKI